MDNNSAITLADEWLTAKEGEERKRTHIRTIELRSLGQPRAPQSVAISAEIRSIITSAYFSIAAKYVDAAEYASDLPHFDSHLTPNLSPSTPSPSPLWRSTRLTWDNALNHCFNMESSIQIFNTRHILINVRLCNITMPFILTTKQGYLMDLMLEYMVQDTS